MENTIVALFSQNRKLTDGSIGVAATYRTVGPTCPQNCAMLNRGCYAQRNLVGIQQRKAKKINGDLDTVGHSPIRFLRLNVSGDFFKKNRLDKSYFRAILDFAKRFPKVQAWGYTHRHGAYGPRKPKMPENLSILASCDSLKDAQDAQKRGWRSARVIHDRSERQAGEAICRFQLDKTPCVKCGLCFSDNKKIRGIVFLKH